MLEEFKEGVYKDFKFLPRGGVLDLDFLRGLDLVGVDSSQKRRFVDYRGTLILPSVGVLNFEEESPRNYKQNFPSISSLISCDPENVFVWR